MRYLHHPPRNQHTQSATAQNAEEDSLMSLLRSEPIVHIQDIIIILVIVPLVMRRLARLSEHPPRVRRRFILELRVRNAVRVDDVRRQLAEGLFSCHMSCQRTAINRTPTPNSAQPTRL